MKNEIKIYDTDLSLYPLGLGTIHGGIAWDDAAADEIFNTFLENGGNVFDTAHVYGDWLSGERARGERVIGDWFKKSGKRNQVILMTKGGHPSLRVPQPDMHKSRMSRKDMTTDLEESLKKLQTDYIDIYFYHRDDCDQTVEELIDTMEDFCRQGKIRYYACSNWSTGRMQEADAYCSRKGYRGFAANQAMLNAGSEGLGMMSDDTMKKADGEMQQYHKQRSENLLMPYMSVCGGFFHRLLAGNAGIKDSPFYTPENLQMGENIRKICEERDVSVTQALLGYFQTLDFPCVPLYGPKNTQQLLDAMKAAELEFRREEYL